VGSGIWARGEGTPTPSDRGSVASDEGGEGQARDRSSSGDDSGEEDGGAGEFTPSPRTWLEFITPSGFLYFMNRCVRAIEVLCLYLLVHVWGFVSQAVNKLVS
jgi:hypothetical protein